MEKHNKITQQYFHKGISSRKDSHLIKNPAGRLIRPWWVKTVNEPTIEIDWNRMQRYDEGGGTVRNAMPKYIGTEEWERANQIGMEMAHHHIIKNTPGFSLRDFAMWYAMIVGAGLPRNFILPAPLPTPEQMSVPKWTGSPEEASQMVRAAMRHMGAALVGFVELDEKTRKLIYSKDPDGKELVFADVDQALETETQRIIPNKCKWVIVYATQMSEESLKRSPTAIAAQHTLLGYAKNSTIQAWTQAFLRVLGYQGLGAGAHNGFGIASAFGVLAGFGEMSRLNRMITPEFGPLVRVFIMLTDLPLATDKPINAGIMQFCKSCKKCAETCPTNTLSYDKEPTWEVKGGWNNPGHKAYFEEATKCMRYWKTGCAGTVCSICFAVCPFSKTDKGWIHNVVKATISTTPVMNGFFRLMDDALGYGLQKDSALWWSLNLPEYGVDSTRLEKR